MDLKEFQYLIEYGFITDVTFVETYLNDPEKLEALTEEELSNMGIVSQIGANEAMVNNHAFTINATPEDCIVIINDKQTNSVLVKAGETVKWSVSKEGYATQQGQDEVNKDTTKDIELVELSKVADNDTNIEYETLDAAIKAGVKNIKLYGDIETSTVIAGPVLNIDGNGKTINGVLRFNYNGEEPVSPNITIKDLNFEGSGAYGSLFSQDQTSKTPAELTLNISNCNFNNYTSTKCIYITNGKEVTIDGCTFNNCKVSDNVIDFNQCATTDANITITNCTFEGSPEQLPTLSFINVKQRGGEDDFSKDVSNNTWIWDEDQSKYVKNENGVKSTISKLIVKDCTFAEGVNNIVLGDNPNEDGSIRAYSGNFPTEIQGEGVTVYQKWLGKEDKHVTTLSAEDVFTNELVQHNHTFTIVSTPEECTVEINDEAVSTKDVQHGSKVTWNVSKDGYVEQSGELTITDDTSKNVDLSKIQLDFTINTTPEDCVVTIGGEQVKTKKVDYGSNVEWSVTKEGYTEQSGTENNVTENVTKDITLELASAGPMEMAAAPVSKSKSKKQ